MCIRDSSRLVALIHRSSNLSCNLLSYWSPKLAYLLTELESLINIRVVGLQVFFLEHLESLDLNICSKSYDLNTKTCTVWIRIFLNFYLCALLLLSSSCKYLGLNRSLSFPLLLVFVTLALVYLQFWQLIFATFALGLKMGFWASFWALFLYFNISRPAHNKS